MSKRKLSRQQRWRVEKIQSERAARSVRREQRIQADEQHLGPAQTGLVTAHFGRLLEVEALQAPWQGQRIKCHIRTNLDTLVTGDQVVWRPQVQDDKLVSGVIEALSERTSLLERPDMRGQMRPVAANIDQILLVVAPEPTPFANLIDRYLVAAEVTGIQAVLVLNKTDLLDQHPQVKALLAAYQALGYPLITTSTQTADGLQALQANLVDKVSVFVGQSGVGKSSLINALLPDVDLKVSELSTQTRKGVHTTTTARLFHFPSGGQLIDSPGIREFALWHMDAQAIFYGFREFRPLIGQCKFRNCSHQQEPGCALQAALDAGDIQASRVQSYFHILATASEYAHLQQRLQPD